MTGPPNGSRGATTDIEISTPGPGPFALVCLGGIPWGNAWKRNQSMVYELAGCGLFDRVLFVNPKEMWLRDELASGHGSLIDRAQRVMSSLPRNRGRNITSLTLIRCLPFKSNANWVARIENRGFRSYLNKLRQDRPFVLLNNHPNFYWKGLLSGLMEDAALSVYDLSDDFLEFHQIERHRKVIGQSLEYSCTNSDLVLAVNDHVAERYRRYNPNTQVVRNATNSENFQRPAYTAIPTLVEIRRNAEAIFGYAGIINRVRLDYELVRRAAEARRQWHFVFLGSADPSFLEMVAAHPNLHYHPTVDYHVLPNWLHGLDAVFVPFERNAHTQGNDLLKVNDGLATGKPVVVAGVDSVERYGDLVRVSHDLDSFVAALDAARMDHSPEMVRRRQEFARENSWTHRTREVRDLLVENLGRKTPGGLV